MFGHFEQGYKYTHSVLASIVHYAYVCYIVTFVCSVQLSMYDMEKRYRNKIILNIIIRLVIELAGFHKGRVSQVHVGRKICRLGEGGRGKGNR